MIEVGELKIGDRVANQWFETGTVINIEYYRSIDDEYEKVFIQFDDGGINLIELFVPTDCLVKIDKLLKNGKGEEKEMNAKFIGMKINYNNIKASKINKYKVIFNNPATILFVDNHDGSTIQKYIVKAHGEEFDEEKGLAMALLRYFGISHLDLKRMIKNAKVQSKGKKTSTNKEEIYVNGEKFGQPELDSEREKLYKEIPQRNIEDNMAKIPFYFDVPTSDIDSGFKVPMAEEKVIVSPKGKKRGQPYKFFAGDKVIVRDCSYYKYTTNANAKQLLNKVWEIGQDNSDFAGSLYVINGVEFAGSELEPVKD